MSDAVLSQGIGYAVVSYCKALIGLIDLTLLPTSQVLGVGLFFSALMIGLTAVQNRYTSYKATNVAEFTSASHSVKLKMNAPHAHTFLEVVKARWGLAGHLTFGFFSFATNIIVSSMLITGGSATVNDLTGMNTYAACMLIPVGVVIYVLVGGMRASLMADYIHTTFLFAIILTFMFVTYTTSDKIGSPGKMYDMLTAVGKAKPVSGNAEGSYLTMKSNGGLIFGVINIAGNFATVYNDQAYWQRAIASEPIPLGFATTMGLAAVVLTTDPSFPGYPTPLTSAQVGAGLPAVYIPYINPHASEKQILAVDHAAIVVYGIFMGCLGCIFHAAGISMGWLYEFMGVVLGSAVVPIAFCVMSTRANKTGAITGAWVGLSAGLIAWLVATATLNGGVVSITTTFQDYCMLSGNLASICTSGIIMTVFSFAWPENFDFEITRALHAHAESPAEEEAKAAAKAARAAERQAANEHEKGGDNKEDTSSPVESIAESYHVELEKAFKLAVWVSVGLVVILLLVIPLPLFFTHYIYSREGFTAWIAVAFVWIFYGAFAVVLYPIWESRGSLKEIGGAILRDVFGGGLRVANKVEA
ncbi:hypothetical protein RQP46_003744 [Phenoliferia psychrophenolica]